MIGFKKLFDSGKKIMAVWILVNSTIWIYMSYILAFMDKEVIAETLSQEVVITVIATFAAYCVATVAEKINEAKNGTIKQKDVHQEDIGI